MNDLQQTLRDLHRELADVPQLDPQQRALLEAALADIQRALAPQGGAGAVPDLAPADAVRAFVDALAKAGI